LPAPRKVYRSERWIIDENHKSSIIPAAGSGTHFIQLKEMLPIVDKPTILNVIKESVEDIIIMTG
jgi:UTP-glucose-1-phosphate uridylyltransferase